MIDMKILDNCYNTITTRANAIASVNAIYAKAQAELDNAARSHRPTAELRARLAKIKKQADCLENAANDHAKAYGWISFSD